MDNDARNKIRSIERDELLEKLEQENENWKNKNNKKVINIDKDDVDNFKLDTLLEYYDIQRDTAHRGDIDSCAEGLLFVKLLDEID